MLVMAVTNCQYALRDSFTIASFNCRGYNEFKVPFIRQLSSQCSVLCLQEHWLSDTQIANLSSISDDFLCTGVCGFDPSAILTGRPYGGCAVLWRSCIDASVDIIDTHSRRLCSVKFKTVDWELLVINVYLPHEGDDAHTEDFFRQLSCIELIISQHPHAHIIVCGDFNVDFARNWRHTNVLNDFCDRLFLVPTVRHCANAIDYSFISSMNHFHTLDHFIVSGTLFDVAVDGTSVLHRGDNLSDHDPVFLQLNLNSRFLSLTEHVSSARPAWYKADERDINSYKTALVNHLALIAVPVEAAICRNVMCTDPSHVSGINMYANQIIEACISATAVAIPKTCMHDPKRVPGWSEYVEPTRQKSLFWHRMWSDCGRPRSGLVADIMRRTRACYHQAVRRVKRDSNFIVRQRFADAMLSSDSRDFWKETKKFSGSHKAHASTIDNCCNPIDIASAFAQKYADLYSSVSYSESEMNDIRDELKKSIERDGCYDNRFVVCVNEVIDAVNNLKPYKGDGSMTGLSTDNFIHACDELFVHVACLLNCIFIHGSVPDDFVVGTTIPIPKNKNVNVTRSENYRGITLSSVFGRILDNIIMRRHVSLLASCDLQFGFKRGRSTAMCTAVVKEVLAYYTQQANSNVFCTFLDASKAFDKVHYCKLFSRLIERNVPPLVIRVLLNMYSGQHVRVLWNGIFSCDFLVKNGVKQGGIISPILFCIYFDDVLCRLQRAGVGCFIGHLFVGALAYADDIVLLAPSAAAMRVMLSICDDFASEYHMSFNASKSKCLILGPRYRTASYSIPEPVFHVNGAAIENVKEWLHLGHMLTSDLTDHVDIARRRNCFIAQVNNMLSQFSALDSLTRNRLFNSFCCSHYGCELWDLQCSAIDDYDTAWRTATRQVWRLPRCSHSRFLPLIANCLPIFDTICLRACNFVSSCANSDSFLLSFIVRHGVHIQRMKSFIGRNIYFCAERFSVSVDSLCSTSRRDVINRFFRSRLLEPDITRALQSLELIFVRDDGLQLDYFSKSEVNDFLRCLLTG